MARVLIIGAGGVGTVVAHKVAKHDCFTDIMLASRTKSKCDQVAQAVGGNRIQTAQVDADSVPDLVKLMQAFRPDIVINVALPYQDLTIMDACLECGASYLDTANYEPKDVAHFEYSWQWAYQDRFKEKGLTAILGCGFDPGVSAIFTAYAAKHHFDEMQYLRREEIAGLIVALHRCNQLRLPIMAFCAGLPKILQEVGEACSYAERLFQYEVVGPLKPEEAAAAITVPAEDFEVAYDSAAVEHIIAQTGGYPYFIQQMCSSVWQITPDKPTITLEDVQEAEPKFWELLDKGFFAVRYQRCTPREKAFIAAMVKCGKLPCTIANVAKLMNKSVSSISPIRAQLISKGMIYPTSHGEIDFTVPKFHEYIKRINPDLQLG